MSRPDQTAEQRQRLLPIVARAFAELGYRRATTAELARRCQVRENILYRLWADKKAMFVASIEYVHQGSAETWATLLRADDSGRSPAERVLEYEAEHYGELGLYRIVYAGLSETDDPGIHRALRHMYGRYHRFIARQIAEHRGEGGKDSRQDAELAAWAIVGLGSVSNVGRELGLISGRRREQLFRKLGRLLLEERD